MNMQSILQTDLNHELNAEIEEWLFENPTATAATVKNALVDAATDFESRHPATNIAE